MTPEEKAKELYDKFYKALEIKDMRQGINIFVKAGVIVCVDEIIKSSPINPSDYAHTLNYWYGVKDEIEKL
jgi:hypothetical protein